MKYYIRIGEPPITGKSRKLGGGYEEGISVYDAVRMTDGWHIIMPLPMSKGQGSTLEYLIQSNRKIYLVVGDEIGIGTDNEPIIRNMKIVKDITDNFNIF